MAARAREVEGTGLCFSPDGRLLMVVDGNKVLRLVEVETGRVLARFESPDSCAVSAATFSRDGSCLIFDTPDGPAVHIWDLARIRGRLAELGLDWEGPLPATAVSAAGRRASLPPLRVDLGTLESHAPCYTEPARAQVTRHTARLAVRPDDFEAYHGRAHAYYLLASLENAIHDFSQAIRLRPTDSHLLIMRAQAYEHDGRREPAIADLEAALESRRRTLPRVNCWLRSVMSDSFTCLRARTGLCPIPRKN